MKKLIITSILVFILDLLSKIIIINNMTINESICIIKNFFYLTYTNNYGAAFSILQNTRLLLITISIVVLVLIINNLKKYKNITKYETICYSLIIGGILGNLFDRIFYGYVIDFLDFYIFGHEFAIFNIADSTIVIGIILLIIYNLRREENNGENSSRQRKRKTR